MNANVSISMLKCVLWVKRNKELVNQKVTGITDTWKFFLNFVYRVVILFHNLISFRKRGIISEK